MGIRVCAWKRNRLDAGYEGRGKEDRPSVTAAIKLWTCDLLLKLPPIGQPPSVHFEIFNIMTQVGHVLGSKCLVWRVE